MLSVVDTLATVAGGQPCPSCAEGVSLDHCDTEVPSNTTVTGNECSADDVRAKCSEPPPSSVDGMNSEDTVDILPRMEPDPSPGPRWKSHSCHRDNKPSTRQCKGNLVINLSGNPRAFVKLSPAPSLIKPFISEDVDESNGLGNSHSEGSQGTLLENNENEKNVPLSSKVETVKGATAAFSHVTSPSSTAVPLSEAAKKVRLRVKRCRIPLKPNLFQRKMEEGVPSLKERTSNVQLQGAGNVDHVPYPNDCTDTSSMVSCEKDLNNASKSIAIKDTCASKERDGYSQTSAKVACSFDDTFEERQGMNEGISNNPHVPRHDTQTCQCQPLLSTEKEINDQGDGYGEALTLKDLDSSGPASNLQVDATCLAGMPSDEKKQVAKWLSTGDQIASKEVSWTPNASGCENGTTSEDFKVELKDQSVPDNVLLDEPLGYSSGGCSERNPKHVRRDFEASVNEGYNDGDSYSEESGGTWYGTSLKGSSHNSLIKHSLTTEQVPSVMCDAKGNDAIRERSVSCYLKAVTELCGIAPPLSSSVFYNNQVQLNWRWPSGSDYVFNVVADASNRSMAMKERSIFVGCIPDGAECLEEHLRSLMEKFLGRFDFAPASIGCLLAVKAVKDYAFLELATEKVAQIVLAANQLDVFEWAVDGHHLNIQGCCGTHSSVRPLIGYVPLKPSRAILVTNIPKVHWQKDYLEAFFSRLLQGSDGACTLKFVSATYLLPESCEAYVEFASDLMAESVIYKCSKNPNLLKEIGEDVFVCRDVCSVPLMSRHKSTVSPQKSLLIVVSAQGEEFKVDCIRKVFIDILPYISIKLNQPGYLEYVVIQPARDCAFFQFNSEAMVDAIMDEYIENTQMFVCKANPVPYIILRHPEYVHPGANLYASTDHLVQKHHLSRRTAVKQEIDGRNGFEQPGKFVSKLPWRFGDEPIKKPDCLMPIDGSMLPATYNSLSSMGACLADPGSMLIVEGLPKGLSYKLLWGALNELFQRLLSEMGLWDAGTLVLTCLDRDGNFDVVASLASPSYVTALVSLRKPVVVAGHEIRLLAKSNRNFSRGSDMLGGQCDLSCLTDEGGGQVKHSSKFSREAWIGTGYGRNGKRRSKRGFHMSLSEGPFERTGLGLDEGKNPPSVQSQFMIKAHCKDMRRVQNGGPKRHAGRMSSLRFAADGNWMDSSPCGYNTPQRCVQRGIGIQVKDSTPVFQADALKIVATESRREVQALFAPVAVCDMVKSVGTVIAKRIKRKVSGPVMNLGLAKRLKQAAQFPGVYTRADARCNM